MLALYGDGFLTAFAQQALFYYLLGAVLHFVIPAVVNVKSIQDQPRGEGEVARDALHSLGGCS
jgi:hypothetical protein